MTGERTHPEHDGNDEEARRGRVRREDFVEVVVDGGESDEQPRPGDRRNGVHRGRRFDRDNSSPIEIEIGDAVVRVVPRIDRVLLSIVFDALRGRR